MKQRITIEDLMELSESQRDRLNDLWIPKRYDLAAGFICKDVENNEYDIFEFTIGHVNVRETGSGYHMTLMNIEALRGLGTQRDEAEADEVQVERSGEEYSEEDFIFEYERPDIYGKEDCLPLLNIGQMLEILNKCGYAGDNYYISYRKDKTWEIGRDIEQYSDFGADCKGEELCDILWEAVKEVL